MISWRRATHRDRRELQRYVCADPEGEYFDSLLRKKGHTEPWAAEVQKGLRRWKHRAEGAEMWLGYESEELVSVGAYTQIFEERVPVDRFLIEYVSCAFEARGSRLGDQCLGQLLADISETTDGRDGVELTAFIHDKNAASRRLFQRFAFAMESTFQDIIREGSGKKRTGADYGVWRAEL
ncbi:hypothetical protein Bra3105_06855 [Brachybacterium halotolerans subsp. kimchii]|uniref:hypothetical protein n=1 Tax=Brachybacterium halotolerans TaxID=2795215 RepID=UPI001E619D4E|nr:hypothetical protein [Brachybacterium halotolerans]UEJ84026.1 hypothetical protein Bra3105_06855 [Brachybacterium halotolerans subsp. kimchii]